MKKGGRDELVMTKKQKKEEKTAIPLSWIIEVLVKVYFRMTWNHTNKETGTNFTVDCLALMIPGP